MRLSQDLENMRGNRIPRLKGNAHGFTQNSRNHYMLMEFVPATAPLH